MLRLKPRDEAFLVLIVDQAAKAQKGVHFVDVATDRFRHLLQAVDERIALHLQKCALAVEDTPNQSVEQRVAFPITVADHQLDELADSPRQRDRPGRTQTFAREEDRHVLGFPHNSRRRDPSGDQRSHSISEAIEIGAWCEGDVMQAHQNKLN
jgi:hypothetical protein